MKLNDSRVILKFFSRYAGYGGSCTAGPLQFPSTQTQCQARRVARLMPVTQG